MTDSLTTRPGGKRAQWFTTTHWSVVVAAHGTDSTAASQAMERLCQAYWYPLYAYVRRHGHSCHDAEDLIQGFFARALEENYFAAAEQEKGRFRSFLLLALKRFMANQWRRHQTLKRGSGQPIVSLDALSAEQRYAMEPRDELTADALFDRRWAMTLLETVLRRLEAEQNEANRGHIFEQLKPALISGGRGANYSGIAEATGLSESAVKVAVHRLKRRYREILELEIANTVASPEQIPAERKYLLAAVSSA